ncbi:MAG: hypothetical protein V4707_00975 [Pseudomonadota bacterium]
MAQSPARFTRSPCPEKAAHGQGEPIGAARLFIAHASGGDMDGETNRLIEHWILTFCEPPPLIDVELMRRVLAEHEARPYGQDIDGAGARG